MTARTLGARALARAYRRLADALDQQVAEAERATKAKRKSARKRARK